MTGDAERGFSARARRERIEPPSQWDQVEHLRAAIARLGELTPERLADRFGDDMLRCEAIVVRAAAMVEKLPADKRAALPSDWVRGLIGVRNVAAHGYGQLDIDITVEVVGTRLPRLLDVIESVLKAPRRGDA